MGVATTEVAVTRCCLEIFEGSHTMTAGPSFVPRPVLVRRRVALRQPRAKAPPAHPNRERAVLGAVQGVDLDGGSGRERTDRLGETGLRRELRAKR